MAQRVLLRLIINETATRTDILPRVTYVEAFNNTPTVNANIGLATVGLTSVITGPPGVHFSGTLGNLSQTIQYHSATTSTPYSRMYWRGSIYVDQSGGKDWQLYPGITAVESAAAVGGGPVTLNASLPLAGLGFVSFTGATSNFNLSDDMDFVLQLDNLVPGAVVKNPVVAAATLPLAGLGFSAQVLAPDGVAFSGTLAGLQAFIVGTTTGSANITAPSITLGTLTASSTIKDPAGFSLTNPLDPITFTGNVIFPSANLSLSATLAGITQSPSTVWQGIARNSGAWAPVTRATGTWANQ